MDKDENQLTELNRELLLKNKKKIKKFEFICNDLNLMDLKKFMIENKINHYLNFAAIKHVRSEENLISAKYMLQTNSFNFVPKNFEKIKSLKSIYSISSDKAVNPSSLLGVSKRIMELNLMKIKKKKSSLFVSTTRFANVSFSNGSILKLIVDRLSFKKKFGIPLNISRYFITHKEAVSLCLKSLLNISDGGIIIPN
jgi:FlaA1/EpsC-like NDP-sugar epimerase